MTSTKKSLALSALSLVICLAMLIGTTFAWFTDSVESGKNQIIAGNLDVELFNGTTKVDTSTKLFNDVEKWEPGAAAFETLQVKNVGNLALKYQLSFLFENETKVDGHGLSEVLKIGTYAGEITDSTKREDVIDAVTDFAPIASFAKNGNLAANTADDAITYVIYWQPGANDNLFNMNNDNKGKTLSIDFWVKLVATQDTVEADSFDKYYDVATIWFGGKDAEGLTKNTDTEAKTIKIYSGEQLAAFADAVNGGNPYTDYTVTLANDIDLNNVPWTPIGAFNASDSGGDPSFNGIFNGNGKTIKNLLIGKEYANTNGVGLFASNATYDDIQIKDLTIDTATVYGNKWVGVISGYMNGASIKNCTVKNATVYCTGYRAGAIAGFAANNAVISGNTADNVTIYVSKTVTEPNNICVGTYTGANGTTYLAANTDTNSKILVPKTITVEIPKNPTKEQVQSAVNEAFVGVEAGATIVIPSSEKSFKLPNVPKDVTVKGDGNTIIDAAKGKLPNINGATLDGLVLNCGQDNYNGFTHSDAVIKNCTIKGLLFSYNAGGEQVFENCTFINDKEGGEYNMWAYGNVSYKNCTFKSNGKFVNVYNEGDGHFDVNFEGCTFINTKATGNKAAINVKDTCDAIQLNITVNINNCSYQGPDAKGDASKFFNNVVQLDDLGTGTTKVKIVKDGVTLWPEAN